MINPTPHTKHCQFLSSSHGQAVKGIQIILEIHTGFIYLVKLKISKLYLKNYISYKQLFLCLFKMNTLYICYNWQLAYSAVPIYKLLWTTSLSSAAGSKNSFDLGESFKVFCCLCGFSRDSWIMADQHTRKLAITCDFNSIAPWDIYSNPTKTTYTQVNSLSHHHNSTPTYRNNKFNVWWYNY